MKVNTIVPWSKLLTVAAICLATASGRASQPDPEPCESEPDGPDGFPAPDAARLTRLLRQAAAAVPRSPGDRCHVEFDDVPQLKRRDACWRLPDQLRVHFECPYRSQLPPDQPLVHFTVTLSTLPADYPAEGEILESTPDLLVVSNPQRLRAEMIFGARRNPWIFKGLSTAYEAEPPPGRLEDGYRGPYVAAVAVSIIAVRPVSADLAKRMLAGFDRAAILKLLKAEQERRRTNKWRPR